MRIRLAEAFKIAELQELGDLLVDRGAAHVAVREPERDVLADPLPWEHGVFLKDIAQSFRHLARYDPLTIDQDIASGRYIEPSE